MTLRVIRDSRKQMIKAIIKAQKLVELVKCARARVCLCVAFCHAAHLKNKIIIYHVQQINVSLLDSNKIIKTICTHI